MPQQTVYIRNDDMELWKAVPNKAQLISDALHNYNSQYNVHDTQGIKARPPLNELALEKLGMTTADKVPETVGKPCCSKATRCQHWQWDGEDWRNTLTGSTRME